MKVIEKFMIIYIIFFIALTALLIYTFTTKEELEMKKVDETLIKGALSINNELRKNFNNIAINKESIKENEHNENSKRLTNLRKKYELIYLYSAIEVDGIIYLTSTSTTDIDIKNNSAAEYFYPYNDASSDLKRAIREDKIIYSEYKDSEGEYRAVFIPFKRDDGKIYVLAAEKDLKEIHLMAEKLFVEIAFVALIMFILLSIIFLGYVKKSENKKAEIERINNELEKKYIDKQKELEGAKEKLTELNITKDKLFSIIGHDLKGPIGNLLSIAEFMSENGDAIDSESRKKIYDSIRKSIENAYFLSINLFEWSKIQRNKVIINKENIKVRELVKRALKDFKHSIEEKEIEVKIDVEENLDIYADITSINIIIHNLVSNCIKYAPIKGNVNISAEISEGETVILVRDNGEGIEKDKLEKIYLLYENKSSYGTNGERGAGLGLIICKSLVEMNNGKIDIRSEFGNGTEYRIYFKLN